MTNFDFGFRIAGILIAILAFGGHSRAQTAAQDNLRNEVRRAVKYTLNATFTGRQIHPDTKNEKLICAQNGKFRFIYNAANRHPPISMNQVVCAYEKGETVWTANLSDNSIRPESLIRKAYQTSNTISAYYEPILDARLENAAVSRRLGEHNGVQRIIITILYPNDDDAIAVAPALCFLNLAPPFDSDDDPGLFERHLTPSAFAANPPLYRESYFAGMELAIDRTPSRPFIHGMRIFNKNGEPIISSDWGTVSFDGKGFDPSFFAPPAGDILEAKNHGEFAGAYMDRIGTGARPPPSLFARIGQWLGGMFSRLALFMLNYGAYVAGGIGAASVGGLLYLKRKKV